MTCLVDCGPQIGWSDWSPCSAPCGNGTRTRTNFFQPDFDICKNKTEDRGSCNEESCTSTTDASTSDASTSDAGDPGEESRGHGDNSLETSKYHKNNRCNNVKNNNNLTRDEGWWRSSTIRFDRVELSWCADNISP